jgi:lipopolysaccharide export LptBFGC system permease protein LptF
MSEPDPFASPYHQVHLPGQPSAPMPVGYGYPAPMPSLSVHELRRPTALTVAFWAWITGALLTVFALPGLYYTGIDAMVEDFYQDARNGAPLSRGEAELTARLTPLAFMAFFAVLAVPFVVAAFKVRAGRNWARVTLAVLGGMALVFGLTALVTFAVEAIPYVHWSLGVAWALVFMGSVLLGVVTMFLPPANAYVRSR